MLGTLKQEKLGLEWRKRQQTRSGVLLTIQEYQDTLPEAYTAESYQTEVQFGVLVCVRGVLAVSVRYFQDIMLLGRCCSLPVSPNNFARPGKTLSS